MYFIFTNEIKYRREAPLKPRKKGAKRPEFLLLLYFFISSNSIKFSKFSKFSKKKTKFVLFCSLILVVFKCASQSRPFF